MGRIDEREDGEGLPTGDEAVTPFLLDRLPEFCSILLSGPPGVGKFQFLMDALGRYLAMGQPVVFVCVDVGPAELRGHLRRSGIDPAAVFGQALSVIDGFTATVSEEGREEQPGIRIVSSLSNLEGLGMAIAESAVAHARPVKVLLYTISTLFLHNSAPSLSKFFQIVSARVKTQMGSILFASQEGVTEPRQENLLRSLVDGVIDMRFNGSLESEVMLHHLRGYRIVPEWLPLPPNGTEVIQAPTTADGESEERSGNA